MLLSFIGQYFCLVVNCFPTFPEVNQISGQSHRDGRSDAFGLEGLDEGLGAPVISVEEGFIEGYYQHTRGGRVIAAFESIPYAQSPTGQGRFADPVPVGPWADVKECVKKPPVCLQLDMTQLLRLHGTEDCLFLNIYTPTLPNNNKWSGSNGGKLLPILFYIHGGGGLSGTSSDFGPAYLLDKDVVLVSINYRVGVLGWLSTGDSASSGNWGMKDQLLALQWVSRNAHNFGGDKNKITIWGISFGAAAVGLHIVSPQSAGLFSSGICESGSALSHWAIQNDTFANSQKIGRLMGCPTRDSSRMISCLRRRDGNWIVGRSMETWKGTPIISRLPFGPVLEKEGHPGAFLTEAPEVIYLKGKASKVPLLIGVARDEGAVFAAGIYMLPPVFAKFNRQWAEMISYAVGFDERTSNVQEVGRKLQNYYLDGKTRLTWRNRKQWIKTFGDRTIVQGSHSGMQYHSPIAPTYGYVLTYEGRQSLVNTFGLRTKDWGVAHGDSHIYLMNSTSFYNPLNPNENDRDYQMSMKMVDFWISFATNGVPSLSDQNDISDNWEPIKTQHSMNIMRIDRETEMIPMPFEERINFWKSLRLKDDHDYPATFV